MSTKPSKKLDRLNSIDRIEALNLLIQHGIDLHTKRLFLRGEVNEEMFARCQNGLAILNQMQPKRITIELTTDGGDVYEAFGMYDLIKNNKFPVDVHAVGYCMSAGPIILQAGKYRTATATTQFMTHAGSESVAGDAASARAAHKHHEAMGKKMAEIIGYEIELTEYFDAKTAKSLGLIDEVT